MLKYICNFYPVVYLTRMLANLLFCIDRGCDIMDIVWHDLESWNIAKILAEIAVYQIKKVSISCDQ